METLLLPFQFVFMQNAFLISLIVAVPAALLSCFLVLKGWALMGDAVAHAVLPGIVLAWMFGLPLLLGAFAAGMFCAVATGYVNTHSRVKEDTVMGVVFSGMFALGLVLFVASGTTLDLEHILFGNMLGVGEDDLKTALWIAGAVTTGLLFFWKDLMLHAFDPAQARAIGLPVTLLHYGLLTAMSLTIVAVLSAVGLILAIGLMIAPGAIAFLIVREFRAMLWVASLVSLFAMLSGTYASFFLNSAPAPTIILVFTALFLAAFVNRMRLNRRRSQLAD